MANSLVYWWHTLPLRLHRLGLPYAKALGLFVAGYAGLTGLLRPWPLGGWWSLGVPLVGGLGVCWGLWRPWALLARTYKGESRRLPLLLTWLLCLALGYQLRQLLRARLAEVRDLRSVAELAQPGEAVYFRLHGPYYVDKPSSGRYAVTDFTQNKGTKTYYATCYYACPLLASPTDTAARRAPAWLGYSYRQEIGYAISAGEVRWRYLNFVARCDACFDTLALGRFAYLEREEDPDAGLYHAVRASRQAAAMTTETPLLLKPVAEPFALRGWDAAGIIVFIMLTLNVLICFCLLLMPLRPRSEWPD